MKPIIKDIAAQIETAFQNDKNALDETKRIPSSIIFSALRSIRPILEREFGRGFPVKCRHAGYNPDDDETKCSDNPNPFKVIEYLVDFSFSKFSIPQAIGDRRAARVQLQKYEILFAVESELGDMNEVCRDLLKLLDLRTEIRCLLFKRRSQRGKVEELNRRLLYVLHNHAHFDDTRHGWLFMGLDIHDGKVRCSATTLADDSNSFVLV